MESIFEVAHSLQAFCDAQGWRSCLIGGIAVQRWGEVRVTRDVDLTLLTGFGGEDAFAQPLLHRFQARISGAAEFARTARVLLLKSHSGIGIDISLGALAYEEEMIRRATALRAPR